jgi:hypothetical protein
MYIRWIWKERRRVVCHHSSREHKIDARWVYRVCKTGIRHGCHLVYSRKTTMIIHIFIVCLTTQLKRLRTTYKENKRREFVIVGIWYVRSGKNKNESHDSFESGMMIMRRPYRVGHLWGFPGTKQKKARSGPRRHDTWDLESERPREPLRDKRKLYLGV